MQINHVAFREGFHLYNFLHFGAGQASEFKVGDTFRGKSLEYIAKNRISSPGVVISIGQLLRRK